jgi:hypothetical protein
MSYFYYVEALMVRSREAASRTMRPRSAYILRDAHQRAPPATTALPLRGDEGIELL